MGIFGVQYHISLVVIPFHPTPCVELSRYGGGTNRNLIRKGWVYLAPFAYVPRGAIDENDGIMQNVFPASFYHA